MGIKQILKGAGNGEGDIVKFDTDNTARMVYVVTDDGGPILASAQSNYVAAAAVTTAVATTVMPAVAGKTNYLTGMMLQNGSATGSEVQIRNGSGGPVLWRGYSSPNGSEPLKFNPALAGSVGALLEVFVVTLGAAIYFNTTGFVQ